MDRAETFPGAACCDILWPETRRYEYREVVGLHAKAAPLQTLGTNTPRQRAKAFEEPLSDLA